MLGDERELGLGEDSFVVILKGDLQLRQAVQNLERDLVEEKGAVAVELRSHPNARPFRERE